MIGIVVVGHSAALVRAAIEFACTMVPEQARPAVVAAAGLDEHTLGTDAAAIAEAIATADSAQAPAADPSRDRGDGVLVLMDLGSAVLSAEMACELLEPPLAARVRLTPAPLVEGLVAAVVTAAAGADLDACDAEARRWLDAKAAHLGEPDGGRAMGEPSTGESAGREPGAADTNSRSDAGDSGDGTLTFSAVIDLPAGLHARPAAAIVNTLAAHDVEVTARNATSGGDAVDGLSPMALLTLGLSRGDVLELVMSGPGSEAALADLSALAAARFGERDPAAATSSKAPTAAPTDPARDR